MRPPLVLRCTLAPDESVPSWVSRLAVRNRAGSARDFCLDMGFTFNACVGGQPAALDKLSVLTGTPLAAIERATIHKRDRLFAFRGEHISQAMLRRKSVHVCPDCVRADLEAAGPDEPAPYGRTLWQFAVMRACPLHGRALIEINDGARGELYDFAAAVRDRSAALVRAADTSPVRKPSRLERYVEDRLEGTPTGAPWLDQIDLHAACALSEMLGLLLTVGPKAKPRHLPMDTLHEAGGVGCAIAQGGEAAIRAALTEVQRRHDHTRSRLESPLGVFGYFYHSLAFREARGFGPIRDLLRRHIIETMPVGPGDIVCGEPVAHRVRHSISTAASETGRDPKRMRAVLAAAGIIGTDHERFPDNAVTFEVAPHRAFLEANSASVPFSAVVTHLGAGRTRAEMLLKHGYIRPAVTCRTKRNARSDNYRLADVDDFLARLRECSVPVESIPKGFRTIPVAAQRAQCSAADVIELVLQKEIKRVVYDSRTSDYLSIYVDPCEVQYRLQDDHSGGVTVSVAASVLGVTKSVIEALVREGIFRLNNNFDHKLGIEVRTIPKKSVSLFASKYITIKELSRFSRLEYHKLWRLLRTTPAEFDPKIVGVKLYLRSDVEYLFQTSSNR